jgi:hypothetical protein
MRFASLLLLTFATASTARAGAALDDGATPKPTTDATARPDTPDLASDKVTYGFDIRLRKVYLPQSVLELFVSRAAGGSSNTGIGFDLVRRRGNLELQLGFEHESIDVAEGVWINKGDTVPGDTVDYVVSPTTGHGPDFGWYTIEFTFLNHAEINKYVAIRYGGGAGLGILSGSVRRWDTQCAAGATNSNVTPYCVPIQYGGQGVTVQDSTGAPETQTVAYNLPPVFPVVNAILGVQIRPTDKIVINVEGGIRTLPFLGISAGAFF